MSCENVERLIKGLALGFMVLFVSGFLVLYYAIRKVACAQGLCESSFRWNSPPIYSADMLAIIFSLSAFFLTLLWYTSSKDEL